MDKKNTKRIGLLRSPYFINIENQNFKNWITQKNRTAHSKKKLFNFKKCVRIIP